MSLKGRLHRLEREAEEGRAGACPRCGGRIIMVERYGGAPKGLCPVAYPFGEPCPVCASVPPGGGIGIIEVAGGDGGAPP